MLDVPLSMLILFCLIWMNLYRTNKQTDVFKAAKMTSEGVNNIPILKYNFAQSPRYFPEDRTQAELSEVTKATITLRTERMTQDNIIVPDV